MNRREFIHAVTSSAAALSPSGLAFANKPAGVSWTIGCFNRPWTQWSYDQALAAMKAAGYKVTGLLTPTKVEPFIGVQATPEYLKSLKERIAGQGLTVNMATLRSRHDIPLEESIQEVEKQIANAKVLSLSYLLTMGIGRPEQQEHYYKVMAAAAARADKAGIKLVMKPHGGSSAASDEIHRSIEAVGHSNFKIWYDAGNIIHYTGKDPVAELKPIVRYVTGFCAKDCAQLKGDVMIQFGTGKVEFRGVFEVLKGAGFDGPLMVECCTVADTPEKTGANAQANREFLERILQTL